MKVTVIVKLGDATIGQTTVECPSSNAEDYQVFTVQADPELTARALVEPIGDEIMRRLRERWNGGMR